VRQTLSQPAPKQSFAFHLPTDNVMDVSSFAQISHNRRTFPSDWRPFSELQDDRTMGLQERGAAASGVAITVMAAVTTTANNRNNNDNHFARTGSMQIYDSKDQDVECADIYVYPYIRIYGHVRIHGYKAFWRCPGQRKRKNPGLNRSP